MQEMESFLRWLMNTTRNELDFAIDLSQVVSNNDN